MPASLSKSLRCLSSPLTKMDEEVTAVLKITGNKQGIVSILGSDCETNKTTASLRRTLSADMSSKKWLEQQGFSPMKRIASVAELPILSSVADSSSSSSDGEEEDFEARRRQLQMWGGSIQEEEEEKKKELENPGQFDIWTSILSQKAEQEDSSKNASNDPAAAPYIHPLVKRSSSSLSEKSLEICTESLGSETGSDGFSSYPPSKTVDLDPEEEQQEEQEEQQQEIEELRIAKYSKKAPPRSFPPPLPSLSRGDGPSLRMQSHRNNGRLVLEAVSVPTQNYFSAQRQDGRLLLTFVNSPNTAEDQPKEDCQEIVEDDKEEMGEWSDGEELGECDKDEEEEEAIEDEYEEDDEVAEIDEVENFGKESIISMVEMEIGMEQQPAPKVVKTEVINVHRAAVMMNKLIRLANRNPTWPKRINEVIKFEDEEEQFEPTPLSKSFPVPPRTVPRLIPSSPTAATAASFNVYENCWRNKQPTTIFSTTPLQKPPPLKNYNNNNNNNNNKFIFSKTTLKANDQQQQLLVLRGDKADYSLHMIKGCKDPRRSLLFWEPHCIATS